MRFAVFGVGLFVAGSLLAAGGVEYDRAKYRFSTRKDLPRILELEKPAPFDPALKTPATSRLFERRVDPDSRAVYYVLKHDAVAFNHQSLYFTHKSMTDDGRYLIFWVADDEFVGTGGVRSVKRDLAYVDFLKDEAKSLPGTGASIPYLDPKTGKIYHINDKGVFSRDLRGDPLTPVRICAIPPELAAKGKVLHYCTHITLAKDRQGAFLESNLRDKSVQGFLDFRTGRWEKWGECDFMCNHGQLNPANDRLALCAWEKAGMKVKGELSPEESAKAQEVKEDKWRTRYSYMTDVRRPACEDYPRLQLIEPGRRAMIPCLANNYATHELWDAQGEGFYWCAGEVYYHDLKTGLQTEIAPKGGHAMMTADRRYVVADSPITPWYRGCKWQVRFHNRETGRGVYLNYANEAYTPRERESRLHPDPHPQFVADDRYVVWTHAVPGRMELAVAVTDEIVPLTLDPMPALRAGLSASCDPKQVGRRLVEHFLASPPERFGMNVPGYTGTDYANFGRLPYAVCSVWVNALAYAGTTGDAALLQRLTAAFEPFFGEKKALCSARNHVDCTIFGAIPLEIYAQTGDPRCRELGLAYADAQWAKPSENDQSEMHRIPFAEQLDYWKNGYTPQTRLWIDDMYMITLLQTEAFRALGGQEPTWRSYGHREAEVYMRRMMREALLYVDRIPSVNGLYHHAPTAPFFWGRGDGWMAAGLALVLKNTPSNWDGYTRILAKYREMMAALLTCQRADGLWGQLLDHPESWSETSGSAMFCCAFLEGVKHGWLDAQTYGPAAVRAWTALCGKLDANANLKDVCVGTGKRANVEWYLNRPRITGDPHGQAPMLWCVNAFLAPAEVDYRREGPSVKGQLTARQMEEERPIVRFGVIADIHHADIPSAPWNGGTHYRLSLKRVEEAVATFAARGEDFVIELGDFKDLARLSDKTPDRVRTIRFADEVEAAFAKFPGPRYHVLGNHDMDVLSKSEILSHYTNTGFRTALPHYSFVRSGVTFIVLDGCYNSKMEDYVGTPCNWDWKDSNVPPAEIDWLKGELARAEGKVIVFIHQRLDSQARQFHRVRNGEDVQRVLEASGKVIGVFQGHDHVGGFAFEHGVNYHTLPAVVMGTEGNHFSEVSVYASGRVDIKHSPF